MSYEKNIKMKKNPDQGPIKTYTIYRSSFVVIIELNVALSFQAVKVKREKHIALAVRDKPI